MNIIFTNHSLFEMERRNVKKSDVEAVIRNPGERIELGKGVVILQSKIFDDDKKKEILIRIIGKELGENFIVITVYRTSKIKKYWQKEE